MLDMPKTIQVRDRATLFSLVIGLNGFTVSSGIIDPKLNSPSIIARPLDMDGSTVVTGNNESAEDALAWATSTMGRFGTRNAGFNGGQTSASLLRPTPDTARLAYLMLAQLGGNL